VTARTYTLADLAKLVGGRLLGDGGIVIRGVAGIREAQAGEITFVANPKYEEFVNKTEASAIIAPPSLSIAQPSIRHEDPYLAFLKVLTAFAAEWMPVFPRGVHETAAVDESARVGRDVSIGAHCQVDRGAVIGDGCTLLHGTYVGVDAKIGRGCVVYPHVVIRERCEVGDRAIIHAGVVIGSDGFGFARDGDIHKKIPQIGRVVIENDVEIGANTTIDRATTGVTRIGSGSKIDNLVQIAHNVVVGKNCVIAAQVGISGSTVIGDRVMIGGQAGLVGHIEVGEDAVIAAQSGVAKSIPAGTMVWGYPARAHGLAKKLNAFYGRLPDMHRRLKDLEQRIADMEKEEKA
jgi:UDP-3-O-[3-hydroxymyristoyl] glucosamine N-acyltransferase